MKRFIIISVFSLVVLFAVAPALADPDIEVVPTSHDFGSVWLGNSATTVITISDTGDHPLLVHSIEPQAGSSEYFAVTEAPPLPVSIPTPDGIPISPVRTERRLVRRGRVLAADTGGGVADIDFFHPTRARSEHLAGKEGLRE